MYSILIQDFCRFHFKLLQNSGCVSLCSVMYPCFLLIHSSLSLLIPYPVLPLAHSLSPLVTSSLFSISMSLFLLGYYLFIRFAFCIPHISENTQYWSLPVWLTHIILFISNTFQENVWKIYTKLLVLVISWIRNCEGLLFSMYLGIILILHKEHAIG